MQKDRINKTLQFLSEVSNLSFEADKYVIPEKDEALVSKYGIPYDEYGNVLQLKLKNFFRDDNLKYSKNLWSEVKHADVLEDILVLDGSGTIIKYHSESNQFESFGKENRNLLLQFQNIIAYYKLFNFLKSNSFCDYFNHANNQIIYYSSVNGVFKITFDTVPVIDTTEVLTDKVNQLIEIAKPVEVSSFFKNAIFTLSNGTGVIHLNELINQSEAVISITKRDFELVSKQFDFDKFKDSLYKEKEKYFANIREVVSKIFSQAVGIPISISATVFATYKVSDDNFMLLVVLIAFLIYVAFYIKIQLVYKEDIIEIDTEFKRDFDVIISKSGLQPEQILIEQGKIKKRIASSISMIHWLISIVISLGLIVFLYILYEMAKTEAFYLVNLIIG